MIEIIIWAVAFVVFVAVEIATFDLVSIWLAAGSLAALFMSIFDLPLWSQLLVFSLASIIMIIATRPIAKKLLKEVKPTNSDLDIGATATVVEAINNKAGTGRVNLKGVHWAAKTVDNEIIPEGTIVVVKEIDGAKLIVDNDRD